MSIRGRLQQGQSCAGRGLEGSQRQREEWEGTAAKQAGVRLPLRCLIISHLTMCARFAPFAHAPGGRREHWQQFVSGSASTQGRRWKCLEMGEGGEEYSTQRSARYWSCWPPSGSECSLVVSKPWNSHPSQDDGFDSHAAPAPPLRPLHISLE